MKNIKEVKNMNIAKILSIALFTLCVETAFAFGFQTYKHDITIQNVTPPPVVDSTPISNAMIEANKMMSEARQQVQQQQFQMQQQQQLLNQQEHLQRLRSDPEYAHRDKLNKKSNALNKVVNESVDTINAFNEKIAILDKKYDKLFTKTAAWFKKHAFPYDRMIVSINKAKALDISKLLPKEQDEFKNLESKMAEIFAKRRATNNKREVSNKKIKESWEKIQDFENRHQKYFTEAQKYLHKIEYDNKAYEAFLNIEEKRAEVLINWAREIEAHFLRLEKGYEEVNEIIAEEIELEKEAKPLFKKYEKFFKKVEKRLGV